MMEPGQQAPRLHHLKSLMGDRNASLFDLGNVPQVFAGLGYNDSSWKASLDFFFFFFF